MGESVQPNVSPLPRPTWHWLNYEVDVWRRDGLLDDAQAEAIMSRYAPTEGALLERKRREFSIARLFGALGAGFVGTGLIWLVAANLDELPPLARFAVVAMIWLGLLLGSEFYASRRTTALTGSIRLLAALAFGAVVFQAAQSLQVPAYAPSLVGAWAVGALIHAYLMRAMGPLLVGVTTLAVWILWDGLWDQFNAITAVILLTVSGLVFVTAADIHDRWLPRFAWPWRYLGFAMALAGLFVAGIPSLDAGRFIWSWSMLLLAATGVINLGIVALRGSRLARIEAAAVFGVVAVSVVLALWRTGHNPEQVSLADWGHATLAVLAYVAVAVGMAVLGTLRNSALLTGMAAVGLVVFTTFQSFAVFARIIQGAWLFVLLGLICLATAWAFDRARRTIAAELTTPPPSQEGTP